MYCGMVLQYAFVQQFAVAQHFQLFIFKVQTKNVNGMEVRSMTDVHLVPVPKSFDQSTEFYAVPVFCSKNDEEVRDWEYNKSWNLYRNYDTRAEFLADIKVGEQLGSLYGYDIESSAPAFVLWRDADGKLFAAGSIESAETDPVGACVLQGKYLFTIDMSEYIENFVYDDSYNPCVSYVPADIYRKIDNQLKSAVLQAEKDEEEARQKAAAERAAAEAALRAAEAAGRREESAAEETEDTASQSAAGRELKEQLDETELEKIATTEKNEALIFDMMEYYAQKSRCYYKRSDFVNFHTAVKCSDLVILSGLRAPENPRSSTSTRRRSASMRAQTSRTARCSWCRCARPGAMTRTFSAMWISRIWFTTRRTRALWTFWCAHSGRRIRISSSWSALRR